MHRVWYAAITNSFVVLISFVSVFYLFLFRKPPAHATQESPTHIEGETGGGAAGRTPSEANVNLEESFWRGKQN